MPKIKLIRIHDSSYYEDTNISQSDLSDWEEVSQEDLDYLLSWESMSVFVKDRIKIVVLEDVTSKENIRGYIKNIKNFIKEQQIKQEEKAKKYKAAEAKRKAEAEKKKLEKAKKLLEKSGLKIIKE